MGSLAVLNFSPQDKTAPQLLHTHNSDKADAHLLRTRATHKSGAFVQVLKVSSYGPAIKLPVGEPG